jgi:hypothetical protein
VVLVVALVDFIDLLACLLDVVWFQMLFEINSIFFGTTAFGGSHRIRAWISR